MLTVILYFISFCLLIYNIFFKDKDTILNTPPITTTIIPLPTTTPLITTTTPLIITTTPLITTTTPLITTKPRSILFSSLIIGASNLGGGGGGAGGILTNNSNIILSATKGESSYNTPGGGGGGGYGSGGGGAGASTVNAIFIGGNGSQGFVYILEEDKLFTENIQNYTPLFSKTYTFIVLGGGGCGGSSYANTGISGNGGDAGQLIIKKIRGITNTTKINITIGQGGKVVDYVGNKAGDTIVSCILSTSTVEFKAIGASPGKSGTANTQSYTIQSPGGIPGKNGETFNENIIDNINSSAPIEILN